MNQQWAIGVDLGGTKVRAANISEQGVVQDSVRIETHADQGADYVIEQLLKACRDLIAKAKTPPVGVGIGVAGQVSKESGVVTYAPNLEWQQIPLKERLEKELHLPVLVLNDVRAATWGEWLYGSAKGCKDFVCLFIGTGVGSGIVSGGKMLEGDNNAAGEIGHTTIDRHGPRCRCGNIGCLEVFAGGWSIADRIRRELKEDPNLSPNLLEHVHDDIDQLSARDIIEFAAKGDPYCQSIVADLTDALICGAVNIANTFNPEKIIFGGGIMEGLPHLIEEIRKGVLERALKATSKQLKLLPPTFVHDAPVIGAAAGLFGSLSRTEESASRR